jgi:hypothetical protein
MPTRGYDDAGSDIGRRAEQRCARGGESSCSSFPPAGLGVRGGPGLEHALDQVAIVVRTLDVSPSRASKHRLMASALVLGKRATRALDGERREMVGGLIARGTG